MKSANSCVVFFELCLDEATAVPIPDTATSKQVPYKDLLKFGFSESTIKRWINHGILLPPSTRPAPNRPSIVPEDNLSRLALIREKNLHSEDEIRWELWKADRKDQTPHIKKILLENFYLPKGKQKADQEATAVQTGDARVADILSAFGLRRSPLAHLQKTLGRDANRTVEQAIPYLTWPFFFGRSDPDSAFLRGEAFEAVFGTPALEWHDRLAQKGLLRLDLWWNELERADDLSLAIIAAVFRHDEKYPSWIKPILGISIRGYKLRWIIRAWTAGLLATAIIENEDAGTLDQMVSNLERVGCKI